MKVLQAETRKLAVLCKDRTPTQISARVDATRGERRYEDAPAFIFKPLEVFFYWLSEVIQPL